MPYRLLILTALLLSLGGCSNVPETIRQSPDNAPQLSQVRQAPLAYLGRRVRWGGSIARVENLQNETRLEIVGRALYGDGEPKNTDTSDGRFIARIDGFLDPAIYAVERRITVIGTIKGSERRMLGEMQYRYPVVKVEDYYLWPEIPERPEYYDPWLYDPWFYDPWHPWYPYPWYRRPYYY